MNQRMRGETKAGVEAVTNTSLAYQLLSPYTAFVAISVDVRVNPQEQSVSVQVPVEMPEGVSHASVFGGAAAGALPVNELTWLLTIPGIYLPIIGCIFRQQLQPDDVG